MKLPSLSAAATAVALAVFAPMSGAVVIHFHALLDGATEVPPVPTPAVGEAHVVYDSATQTLDIYAEWTGLIGVTTVAHIHCCTALPFSTVQNVGVAFTPGTLPGFPPGVTSGIYDPLPIDMTLSTNYTAAFLAANGGTAAGAEAALVAGMINNRAYFNIHTQAFPGGEIRGFLEVPEPFTLALLGIGLAGIGVTRRRTS